MTTTNGTKRETKATNGAVEAESAPRLKTTAAALTAESEAVQAREREIADIARRGVPDPMTEFRDAWPCFDHADDPVAAALDQVGREMRLMQEMIELQAKTGDSWMGDLSMSLLVASQKIDAIETLSRRLRVRADRREVELLGQLAETDSPDNAPEAAKKGADGKYRVQDDELGSAAIILKDVIRKLCEATLIVDDCHRDEDCLDTDDLEGALAYLAGARRNAGVVLKNIDRAVARLNAEQGGAS
jgi:hypothetical protein